MMGHKLSRSVVTLFVLASATALLAAANAETPGPGSPGNGVPPITEGQRQFLSEVARRTLRDLALDRGAYELQYVPLALRSLETEALVRLREQGYLLGTGVAGPGPVAQVVRDAALTAGSAFEKNGQEALLSINRMLIEIEVLGPEEYLEIDADWTDPHLIAPHIEPGVHGFVLRAQNVRPQYCCPSEIFTSDIIVEDAVRHASQTLLALQAKIVDMKVLRFRTAHWYQPASGEKTVSLRRGLTVIPEDAVTPEKVNAAIDTLVDYMLYRQLPSGLFSYQYESARNVYTADDNLVRQAGAVASIAIHAKWSGKSATGGAADMGIRRSLKGFTLVPGDDQAAYIATDDGQNKLGVTALTCIALGQHPQAERYRQQRRKLVRGMLWLQRPSGMFITAFPPAVQIDAQEYFPGEALLAMAMDYDLEPTAEVLDAFDRAIAFYRVYFQGQPSPAFVPWQVQAFALMAHKTKRTDYVEYVFELTDWLAEKQLDRSNCAWPEMRGGISSYQPGRAGVSTAAYLEGFADALHLAREHDDAQRVRRYEEVVRLATRFVMQLQVRPEETYFIRSPKDAIGAIRTSPSLNVYRIDHCQHALMGLMKAHDVLFGKLD
jgi:hypothetical protein